MFIACCQSDNDASAHVCLFILSVVLAKLINCCMDFNETLKKMCKISQCHKTVLEDRYKDGPRCCFSDWIWTTWAQEVVGDMHSF